MNALPPASSRTTPATSPGPAVFPGRLSTRLLLAFSVLVAVYFLLMMAPMHILIKRDYVAEAAASFEAALARHAGALTAAADRDDRLALDRLCAELNEEFQGRISLIGMDGAVIADSVSARCLARAKPDCLPTIQAHRLQALRRYMPLEDTVTVRLPVRLGSRGPATARLVLPLQPVRSKLRRMTGFLVVTACSALLVALGIGMLVSRRIAKPVEQMTRVAERIAAGDFTGTPPAAGSDEIGRLAQALSHMQNNMAETMRRLAEERNQAMAMVQHLTDGIIVTTPDNRVLFANNASATLLDTGPLEAGVPLPAPAPILELLDEARSTRREVVRELGDVRQGDRVIRAAATPVATDTEQAGRVILTLRDMTEARRTENLGRELIANASHELRTPLAVISSSAETLLEAATGAPPGQREFLDIIARQAQRLETLVRESLELSQLDSAAPAEPRQPAVAAELCREVVATLGPAAAQRRIDIELQDETDDGGALPAFVSILRQGIANLVDNAIRYTPPDGAVRVILRAEEQWLFIEVADTGPGIPAAEQKRIFERFVRGRDTGKKNIEGSGLGLAIVRRVAEMHGGRVELKSAPGQGSRFTLVLPRQRFPIGAGSQRRA